MDGRPGSNTSESPTQMTSTENGPPVPHFNLPSASRNTNTSPLTNPSNGRSSEVSEVAHSSEQGVPYERILDGCYLSVPVTKEVRTLVMDEELFDDGYDSDGQVGPFFDAVANEVDFDSYEEDAHEHVPPVPVVQAEAMPPVPEPLDPSSSAASSYTPLTQSEIWQMKVKELREALSAQKQRQTGNKSELVERLLQCMHLPPTTNLPGTTSETNANAEVIVTPTDSCFDPNCRWEQLEPDLTQRVPEPTAGTGLLGPTTFASGATSEAPKYQYDIEIDHAPFTALSKEYVVKRNGEVKKDRHGKPVMDEVIRKKGRPKLSFLEKNKLTIDSHPVEWFQSLLPDRARAFDPPQVVSIEQWVQYLNLKAALAQAGSLIYPDFTPFNNEELKQHMGLYILNGLSPSRQISHKFKSQRADPINGSDLCCNSFGPNAERRHKHFRCFFACQNPVLEVPSTKTHPNHKVDPFLLWMQVFQWMLGTLVSIDPVMSNLLDLLAITKISSKSITKKRVMAF